ncbi:MAG: HPP family protein, partial [Candidatus Nanohaloarchaea archaeon]|nr:HPP family protein [Candidatus Nanohaloarchaea archaeon]
MPHRVKRVIRRRLTEQWRRWLSNTSHLTHVSVLLFTTLSVVVLIELGILSHISYFLFPPLASASFTLFYDPERVYSSVKRLVIGLTLGAFAGWAGFQLYGFGGFAAGFALVLTGLLTWLTGTEHPSAFSSSLLSFVLKTQSPLYIIAVFVSTIIVATIFYLWKTQIYEKRAEYLYESTWSDDRLLIPITGSTDRNDIELAATVAGAHPGGRLVLLKIVGTEHEPTPIEELEGIAEDVQAAHDIEVELAVLEVPQLDPSHILDAADRYSCNTIFVPWDGSTDDLGYLAGLLEADEDVIL